MKIVGTILLVTLLLAGGAVAAYSLIGTQSAKRAGAMLLAEARAIEAEPLLRPVHASPSDAASFGDAAAPLLARLPHDFDEPLHPLRRDKLHPIDEAVVRGILAATHARSAKVPVSFHKARAFYPFRHVAAIAMDLAHAAADAGHAREAADLCIDALALGRDLFTVGSYQGRVVLDDVLAGCKDVLIKGDEVTVAGLRGLRAGLPAFVDVTRRQQFWSALDIYGNYLPRDSFSPAMNEYVATSSHKYESTWWLDGYMGIEWAEWMDRNEHMLAPLRASSVAERDRAFASMANDSFTTGAAWIKLTRDEDDHYRATALLIEQLAHKSE